MNEVDLFYPSNSEEWRAWLQENHVEKQSVWVIFHKKKSGVPTISWSEAVDEALCFGWIDSVKRPHTEGRTIQYFTKRKAVSTWSKINKAKVQHLTEAGRMTEAGLCIIETAKQNGSWTILDAVEELIVPDDLEQALATKPGATEFFVSLSKSMKKQLLYWIVSAKREETRQNRITEIVENAGQGKKPKGFR
ncbi:MAG: YdeI/OmpD-associated family protein [Fluviicola sp.]|nr:YdeI/OmpD-associated family protein [Fluviicola sp.]